MSFKYYVIGFITLFFFEGLFAQNADAIIGNYRLPNKLDLEIFKDGTSYSGKIIAINKLDFDQTLDVKNPDKEKRKDLLLDKVIVSDLQFDTIEKKWVNGKMYGPEKGMTFNLEITKVSAEEIEVVGSKYFFWRTLKWKKLIN